VLSLVRLFLAYAPKCQSLCLNGPQRGCADASGIFALVPRQMVYILAMIRRRSLIWADQFVSRFRWAEYSGFTVSL